MTHLPPKSEPILAAAIQLEAEAGNVSSNLSRAEKLAKESIAKGAKIIALPEFFTSRIIFSEKTFEAVLPPSNEAVDFLKHIAQSNQCWIGGSMLIADQGQVYNRYHFVEPDGTVHLHDKDLPTMWENAFYAPGKDSGVFQTGIGGIGAAMCWELIRNQTTLRLKGKIELAMTGTHWWNKPNNWGKITNNLFSSTGQYNRYLSENAPAEFARRLGVPVIQASHCGEFSTDFMLLPGLSKGVNYKTEFVGCTQIVDAHGNVLASRRTQDGPGIVTATIKLGAIEPDLSTKESFWTHSLTTTQKLYWHHQNLCGKVFYRQKGKNMGLENAKNY